VGYARKKVDWQDASTCFTISSAAHQAEYGQAFLFIDRPLQRLQPSTRPETRQITPLLEDFGALWAGACLFEVDALLMVDSNQVAKTATEASPVAARFISSHEVLSFLYT
jgi:hypothetical protein